ncbi:hypothetical protein HAX54_051851 [Datura stramonium]|uniref:Uncharacterized protein n=1 Tax=Datura stramonium TaxID=4076 RepID=A0ABS8WQ96_DATST|nr:hypothetical protein [Datura stramonium]
MLESRVEMPPPPPPALYKHCPTPSPFRDELLLARSNAAFEIYKKAANQANELCEFYDWCKSLGLCSMYDTLSLTKSHLPSQPLRISSMGCGNRQMIRPLHYAAIQSAFILKTSHNNLELGWEPGRSTLELHFSCVKVAEFLGLVKSAAGLGPSLSSRSGILLILAAASLCLAQYTSFVLLSRTLSSLP